MKGYHAGHHIAKWSLHMEFECDVGSLSRSADASSRLLLSGTSMDYAKTVKSVATTLWDNNAVSEVDSRTDCYSRLPSPDSVHISRTLSKNGGRLLILIGSILFDA